MNNKHFRNSEKTWDSIAKSFDKTRNKPWEKCIDFIDRLPEDSVVADFGCGNGRHLIPCARRCKKVYGIDISKNLLDIVKEKLEKKYLENVILINSNLINIPLENDYLDSILYIASLHNIKNRENRIRSLKELRRTLKKDKNALVSVWSRWQDRFREHFKKIELDKSENEDEFGDVTIYWKQNKLNIPRFYHLYSKEEFIEDLKKANLKIKKIDEVKLVSKKYPDNFFSIVSK